MGQLTSIQIAQFRTLQQVDQPIAKFTVTLRGLHCVV